MNTLFDIVVEYILDQTYVYGDLARLHGKLPKLVVEHLQEQYFHYHMRKEDERVSKFNYEKFYSSLEGGTLEPRLHYKIKRKYWRCTQWCDYALLPLENHPNQRKRVYINNMHAYYCHTCWFDKVSVHYNAQMLDQNVQVGIREVKEEYVLNGRIFEGLAYNYECDSCKHSIIEISGPVPEEDLEEESEVEDSEEEDYGNAYSEEDSAEDSDKDEWEANDYEKAAGGILLG